MKAAQLWVHGLRADGAMGRIDVLRLDEPSFRAYVLDVLAAKGLIEARPETTVGGERLTYREQVGELLTLR